MIKDVHGDGLFTRIEDRADNEYRKYLCPYDGDTIKVHRDVFYGYCPTCQLTYVDYVPKKHQEEFHRSNAEIKLNLGGYGSGKTTMSCAEIAEHILTVDNGRTMLVANTIEQARRTVIAELKKFIDLDRTGKFIESHTKSPLEWKLTNGHEIFVMASDSDEKLRSLNVTAFYMEEASGIDVSIYLQLKARLRNPAGLVFNENGEQVGSRLLGIICSNPEDGWLVDDVLKYCNKIFLTPSVPRTAIKTLQRDKTENFEAFLSSTRDNLDSLPRSFIQTLAKGRSKQWVAKYIDCDIATREGLVYPGWIDAVLDHEIPFGDHWKRVVGYDSGFQDPTAIIFGAVDPRNGVIHLYKEYYETGLILSSHAKFLNEELRGKELLQPIKTSPELFSRTVRSARTNAEYLQSMVDHTIEPATNKIDYGINKLRDYLNTGKIKIYPSLVNLASEFRGYTYLEGKEKPVDLNNHLMDALRYMVADFPENPHEFNEAYINSHSIKSLSMGRDYDMIDSEEASSMRGEAVFGFADRFRSEATVKHEGGYFYDESKFWDR